MAGPGLSTSRAAGQSGHVSDTNTVHSYVNLLDTTFLTPNTDGEVLTWDGTSSTAKWEAVPAGGADAETIRDTIATALVAGSNITITVNDAGDTITIASTAGGSTNFGSTTLVPLSSFTGASDSAKFRDACADLDGVSADAMPAVVIPPGTTLDAGANNPFILPNYFHMMCTPAVTDEFGYGSTVNIRHTGSSSGTASTLGVFKMKTGPTKGQRFTGITFVGTSTTRAFCDTAQDASDSAYWQYVHFRDVSFDQFESVFQNTGTGILWDGVAYFNNFAATRSIFNMAGSDHQLTYTGFAEMGAVGSYSTRRSLTAMFRFPNTNATYGGLYTTGSPTTPYRIEAGITGMTFSDTIMEGRPSPGTVGGDTPTDGLHCAGALVRMSGGRATFKLRHFGYAMRDPVSVSGFQPGGYFDVRGGEISVLGGTFQTYTNTLYPAFTLPNGTAVGADTQPPLGWISGASTRANFHGILRGSNATSAPVVYAHDGATVRTDGSVTVVTV
jgi:hypothetical protein